MLALVNPRFDVAIGEGRTTGWASGCFVVVVVAVAVMVVVVVFVEVLIPADEAAPWVVAVGLVAEKEGVWV